MGVRDGGCTAAGLRNPTGPLPRPPRHPLVRRRLHQRRRPAACSAPTTTAASTTPSTRPDTYPAGRSASTGGPRHTGTRDSRGHGEAVVMPSQDTGWHARNYTRGPLLTRCRRHTLIARLAVQRRAFRSSGSRQVRPPQSPVWSTGVKIDRRAQHYASDPQENEDLQPDVPSSTVVRHESRNWDDASRAAAATPRDRRQRPARPSGRRLRRELCSGDMIEAAQDGKASEQDKESGQRNDPHGARHRHGNMSRRSRRRRPAEPKPRDAPQRDRRDLSYRGGAEQDDQRGNDAMEARSRSGHSVRAMPETAWATIATATSLRP